MGLKGVEHKGLKISTKHANFIENLGGATKDNYIELVDKINSEVEKEMDIVLRQRLLFFASFLLVIFFSNQAHSSTD